MTMKLFKNDINVTKFNYGNYSSDNYGTHCLAFTDINNNDYYFSYDTLIAVRTSDGKLIIRQNDWGTTTGKHLNWINEDKSIRLTEDEFNEELKKNLLN